MRHVDGQRKRPNVDLDGRYTSINLCLRNSRYNLMDSWMRRMLSACCAELYSP